MMTAIPDWGKKRTLPYLHGYNVYIPSLCVLLRAHSFAHRGRGPQEQCIFPASTMPCTQELQSLVNTVSSSSSLSNTMREVLIGRPSRRFFPVRPHPTSRNSPSLRQLADNPAGAEESLLVTRRVRGCVPQSPATDLGAISSPALWKGNRSSTPAGTTSVETRQASAMSARSNLSPVPSRSREHAPPLIRRSASRSRWFSPTRPHGPGALVLAGIDSMAGDQPGGRARMGIRWPLC
jgi:hypothetical protein